MMSKGKYIVLGLAVLLFSSFMAPDGGKKKDNSQRVYVFGVSRNFNDSILYITDIQSLDSVVIRDDEAIEGYEDYALQLRAHMEMKLGDKDQTTAFYYSPKMAKLEKRRNKMQKRWLNSKKLTILPITKDEFRFVRE